MNHLFNKSFRLINLLPLKTSNCQQFCRICLNRQIGRQFSDYSKSLRNVSPLSTKTNESFSTLLSIHYRFRTFSSKLLFSTKSQNNQRLNQIDRNGVKDKTSETPKPQDFTEWQQMKEMSLTKKLKFMFTKYWYISLPVHFITSVLWFGSSYLIAKSGVDVKPILDYIRPYIEKLPLPEYIQHLFTSDTNASSVGYVAIALIFYKLATPARYASTVGVSYYAIEFFVKRGLIKPVPTGQQIKAQVINSRSKFNKALTERLAKKENLKKKSKNKKTPK